MVKDWPGVIIAASNRRAGGMGGGIGVIVFAIIGGVGGYVLAKFKGKPNLAKFWAIGCAVLPFVLPILTILPRRQGTRAERPAVAIPLLTLANLAIVGSLGLWGWSVYYMGVAFGLPACSSNAATETLRSAVENSPTGRTTGLRYVAVLNAKETSGTSEERHCAARAVLNNGAEKDVTFRVFTRPGVDTFLVYTDLQ